MSEESRKRLMEAMGGEAHKRTPEDDLQKRLIEAGAADFPIEKSIPEAFTGLKAGSTITGDEIEKAIVDKGKTAPRITPQDVKDAIVAVEYSVHAGSTLTICVLTLRNGFTIVGKSAAASAANFDEELGREISYKDAFNQVWPLLGYALRDRLHAEQDLASKIERIAYMCHQVNRGYCASLGDTSQLPWAEAPEWARESARKGVGMHLANPDATPADSHNSWLAEKEADGWRYGPVKNVEEKMHPCYVPYEELPPEQRAKDFIFKAVVEALR